MARPRINKTTRKGGGTSFGKQSDAEKSFYKRKKGPRSDEPREERSGFRPSGGAGPRGFRKTHDRAEKGPGEKRFPSSRPGGRPFARKGPGAPPTFGDRENKFEKKRPFRSGPGEGPPRSGSFREGGFRREGPRKESSDRRGSGKFEKKRPFKERGDFKPPFKPRRPGTGGFTRKDEGSGKPAGNQEFTRKKSFPADERKSFVQSRVVRSGEFTKTIRQEIPQKPEGLTRLNKYIANAGVGSRRQADELIKLGLVSVNGVTITELGTKVKPGDIVRYEDRVLKAERLVYVLINKPKGFITTTDDPQERNTVMAIVAGACKERIYPVGRLDRNTTGLLLLTNDGDLADKLTHPSYKAKKVYKAELDRPLTKNDLNAIREGVKLEEGRAMVDDIAILSDDNRTVGLEIHIGWNRVVRRIFESLGYEVVKLDRSVFAGLDKKDLGRGQWRFLKPEEVIRLKHFK